MNGYLLMASLAAALLWAVPVGHFVTGASAAIYSVDVTYNLLDGHINSGGGNTEFESSYIPVSCPTLFAGDVINTTITFTQGLALTINDPGPATQLLGAFFTQTNGGDGIVSASSSCLYCIHMAIY